MSDQPPPAKPKPGSLRDRIAAFESKPAATPGDRPAPAPRPKPGGLSWKPRASSPTSESSAAAATSPTERGNAPEKRAAGGMSASDAKESIGMGGSLKDRMAALQGRGAFGGVGGAAPPPKPATEKPKWKPPPVVSPPSEDEGEAPGDRSESIKSPSNNLKSPIDEPSKPEAGDDSAPAAEGGEGTGEVDPEEEERQRRAAIAARMARLGGAKVGMSPPVFGKKPSIKKVEAPIDSETQSADSNPAVSPGNQTSVKSPHTEVTPQATSDKPEGEATSDYFEGTAQRKNSASSSMLSVDSTSQPAKSPSSMPIPSVPRRAAPPRKKAVKSPSPAPPAPQILAQPLEESPEHLSDVKSDAVSESQHELKAEGDRQQEIGEVEKNAEPGSEADKVSETAPAPVMLSEGHLVKSPPIDDESDTEKGKGDREPEIYTREASKSENHGEQTESANEASKPPATDAASPSTPTPSEIDKSVATDTHSAEEPDVELTEEEEEVARRKRVAEKLAKMGGINPFAPRPQAIAPPAESDTEAKIHDQPTVSSPPAAPIDPATIESGTSTPDSTVSASPPPTAINREVHPEPQDVESIKSAASISDEEREHELGEDDLNDPLDVNATQHSQGYRDRESDDHESRGVHEVSETPTSHDHEDKSNLVESKEAEEEKEADDNVHNNEPQETASSQPSRKIPPLPVQSTPEVVQERTASQSTRRSLPPPPEPSSPTLPSDEESEPREAATTRKPSGSTESPPVAGDKGDAEEEPEQAQDIDGLEEEAPPPPRRKSVDLPMQSANSPASPTRRDSVAPPMPAPFSPTSPLRKEQPASQSAPVAPSRPIPSNLSINDEQEPTHEILDEEEGDPIDPEFHSPSKNSPSSANQEPPSVSDNEPPSAPVPGDNTEEDSELTRRRTIAERMAKLGGIKFGAPPPIGRPPPGAARAEVPSGRLENAAHEENVEEDTLTEEEEERARKERIASKLAGMGGIGMFGAPPPRARREESEIAATTVISPPPPPQRAVPPTRAPPPQPQDTESDGSHYTSEGEGEGTKVEAEDSEIEEVTHEDAIEPEAPPPVPSRGARRSSSIQSTDAVPPPRATQSPPPLPGGRPPIPSVPTNVVHRKSTGGRKSSADHTLSSARMGSFDTSRGAPPILAQPPAQSEYVMVEEPEEALPPPPPSRPHRSPPSQTVAPPSNAGNAPDSKISPAPASMNFDGPQLDLSLSSWSDDQTAQSAPPPPVRKETQPQSSQAPPKPATDVQLSSDELTAIWGRVGVQLCEVATTMFEKSKKSLVGDGSYHGFLSAVLSQVPNALPPSASGYGYLIYAQTGAAVQRRVSDIMPGDVVALYDAKLKGHKGLTSYHQDVGTGEPLVGVVSDFEAKKSKIKVFHANQHVGQQTVESVSYRLEDLKSGMVKVFRVLEV